MSEDSAKSAFASKTVHFNWISAVVWPFLPKHFREDPNSPELVMAWLGIGNVILRFMTSSAIRIAFKPRGNEDEKKA